MSRITHLHNGAMIKADVVKSFQDALDIECNKWTDGSIIWDYVAADMHMDLSGVYASSYIDECFDVLAETEVLGV